MTYARLHRFSKPWVKHFPSGLTGWEIWKDVIIEPH